LIYSGDRDFIVNWRGSENWTNEFKWERQSEFRSTEYSPYTIDGRKYGEYKNVDNFTFLRIYEAGHMVPLD